MFSDHVKILVDGAFFSLNMQVIFYSVLVMKPLEKMNTNTTVESRFKKARFKKESRFKKDCWYYPFDLRKIFFLKKWKK